MHKFKTSDNRDILIIDGYVASRDQLAFRLRSAGMLIDIAQSGIHAIKLAEDKNYKLIIISNHMYDMTINEIIMIIHSIKTKPNIPIVLFAPRQDDNCDLSLAITQYEIPHILAQKDYKLLSDIINKYVKK